MIPDIFLSYNREDQAVAKLYADAFAREGLEVWWDATLRPGEAYDQVTEKALREAKAVVVLWSRRSVESRWVRAEATLADRNRTLVPVRIEPCELPIMFELTQTADLAHWQGETGNPAWRAFLGDVRRFVATETAPQPAQGAMMTAEPARSSKPSIAVLPFINRSGVTEDDVFADGMVEDLTAALSLSRRMKVIASSATAAYRTGARNLRQIGRELGVRYLLEGNVRRVGNDFRVTAQLVEAEDGDIVWTQKFDRPLAEIGTLQEDLVTEVAACLGAEVHRSEIEHALRKPDDISAWEAVLRAEANLARGTRPGLEDAVAEARRAVAIDPGYDMALATLAVTLGYLYGLRGAGDPRLKQEVLDTVSSACLREPNDPIALSRIGQALNFVGNFQQGLPFVERAVRLNPRLETPHMALGGILLQMGRWNEGIAELEAAQALAPNGYWQHTLLYSMARAHFNAGDFERAAERAARSLDLNYSVTAQILLMLSLIQLDRRTEAHDTMRRMCERDTEMSVADVEHFARTALFSPALNPQSAQDHLAALRGLWDDAQPKPGAA